VRIPRSTPWSEPILSTLTMWGLSDLIAGSDLPAANGCGCARDNCRHVQTYWKPGSTNPWQNDHVFASSAIGVTSVSVDQGAVTDHYLWDPAVVDID